MLVGPSVGEMIATAPPQFVRDGNNPLAQLGVPYEDVAFETAEGLTLRGWLIPADRPGAPAVLYAPGTGQDQRSGLSLVLPFHRAGYHVLLFSYRGYGASDGNRVGFTYGEAESRDVDAAVRFLYEEKGIRQVATLGYSAGAASVILSAARNPQVTAVVAVAPYNSVAEVWNTSRPPLMPPFLQNWALWLAEKRKGFDRYEVSPLSVVSRIAPRPLLVIHGTADQRIREAQVRRLFAAAQQPKDLWLVPGANHVSILRLVLDDLAPQVIAFLDGALASQARAGQEQIARAPYPNPSPAHEPGAN